MTPSFIPIHSSAAIEREFDPPSKHDGAFTKDERKLILAAVLKRKNSVTLPKWTLRIRYLGHGVVWVQATRGFVPCGYLTVHKLKEDTYEEEATDDSKS